MLFAPSRRYSVSSLKRSEDIDSLFLCAPFKSLQNAFMEEKSLMFDPISYYSF